MNELYTNNYESMVNNYVTIELMVHICNDLKELERLHLVRLDLYNSLKLMEKTFNS